MRERERDRERQRERDRERQRERDRERETERQRECVERETVWREKEKLCGENQLSPSTGLMVLY